MGLEGEKCQKYITPLLPTAILECEKNRKYMTPLLPTAILRVL